MTDSKPDLLAIRKRVEAATEGPWRFDFDENDQANLHGPADRWIALLPHQGVRSIEQQSRADVTFLKHARTDIPALLSRVEELEAALRKIAKSEHLNCSGAQTSGRLDCDCHVGVAAAALRGGK